MYHTCTAIQFLPFMRWQFTCRLAWWCQLAVPRGRRRALRGVDGSLHPGAGCARWRTLAVATATRGRHAVGPGPVGLVTSGCGELRGVQLRLAGRPGRRARTG